MVNLMSNTRKYVKVSELKDYIKEHLAEVSDKPFIPHAVYNKGMESLTIYLSNEPGYHDSSSIKGGNIEEIISFDNKTVVGVVAYGIKKLVEEAYRWSDVYCGSCNKLFEYDTETLEDVYCPYCNTTVIEVN